MDQEKLIQQFIKKTVGVAKRVDAEHYLDRYSTSLASGGLDRVVEIFWNEGSVAPAATPSAAAAAAVRPAAAAPSQMTPEQRRRQEEWDLNQALAASLEAPAAAPSAGAVRVRAEEEAREARELQQALDAVARLKGPQDDEPHAPRRNRSIQETLNSYHPEPGKGPGEVQRMYMALAKIFTPDEWFIVNVPGDGWCSIYAAMIDGKIYKDIKDKADGSNVMNKINESVKEMLGEYVVARTDAVQRALREQGTTFLRNAFTEFYKVKDRELRDLSRAARESDGKLLPQFITKKLLLPTITLPRVDEFKKIDDNHGEIDRVTGNPQVAIERFLKKGLVTMLSSGTPAEKHAVILAAKVGGVETDAIKKSLKLTGHEAAVKQEKLYKEKIKKTLGQLTNREILIKMAQELNIITAHDGTELGIIDENPEGKDIINIPGRPPILTSSWTAIMAELQDVDTTPGEILKYLPFGLSFIYQEPMNILQLGVMSTRDGEMGSQILFRGDDSGSIDYKDDTDKREGPTLIILTGYNHTVAIYNPDLRKQEKLVTELLENPNLWKMALDYRVAITAPTERLDDDDKTWAVIEQSLGVVSDKSREYLLAQAADAIDAKTREAAGSSAQHAALSSGAAVGSSAQHAALSSGAAVGSSAQHARINAEALRDMNEQVKRLQDEIREIEQVLVSSPRLLTLPVTIDGEERWLHRDAVKDVLENKTVELTTINLAIVKVRSDSRRFSLAVPLSSSTAMEYEEARMGRGRGGHNKRKTKRIKKTKHTKTNHKKIKRKQTKHKQTKHKQTKHKQTKRKQTKRKNTKHKKTKHKKTKHTKTKYKQTKRKQTKRKKTKRKNTKHKKTKCKQTKH
jgi:hypothetical protein